jgi:hypothetical protein
MAEPMQIIVGIIFLVLVFIATRYAIFVRIERACNAEQSPIEGGVVGKTQTERVYLKLKPADLRMP